MPAVELGGDTVAVAIVFGVFAAGELADDILRALRIGQPLAGTDSSSRLAARATAKLIVRARSELDASFNLQKDSTGRAN